MDVTLTLTDDDVDLLEELALELMDDWHAKALGVSIDVQVAARYALMIGLATLRGEARPNTGAPTTPSTEAPATTTTPHTHGDRLRPPDGWIPWAETDPVPPEQAAAHSYYTARGWERYWGFFGDNEIVLYWSSDPSKQTSVEAPSPEYQVVQVPDYGPAHIIASVYRGQRVAETGEAASGGAAALAGKSNVLSS